jgi:hypothetical protein
MAEAAKRLTLDELRQTSEYLMLTQKQQLFVATYVGTGMAEGHYNVVSAIKTAYACKSEEVARVMSYTMMQNIRILAVLNLHFGVSPTVQFVKELDRAIRNKKITNAQVELLILKSKMLNVGTFIEKHHAVRRTHRTSKEIDALQEAEEAVKAEKKSKKTKPPVPVTPPPDEPNWNG